MSVHHYDEFANVFNEDGIGAAALMKGRARKIEAPPPDREQAVGDQPWQSVRPDRIERARKLAADPNYPPKEVLSAVAGLLAQHLHGEEKGNEKKGR